MLYIDFEGETVDDAVANALKELNLSKEEIKVEVLQKGKKGFFGVGKKELAKVRIYYKEESKIVDIINEIKTIIGYLDREAVVKIEENDQNRYNVIIHSKDINHLIGKRGNHLKSIQTIVNALLKRTENDYKIIVDIGNYNQKRENELLEWVNQKAKQVMDTKKPVILKSFNSYKRRLIHLEIKKYNQLVCESKGQGKVKNIKISYQEVQS